jgi:hypothetical protein
MAISVLCKAGWEVELATDTATANASAAYGNLLAFDEINRQYNVSAGTYRRGQLDLACLRGDETNPYLTQAIVELVGLEVLREAGSWLALNQDRSVRPK